MLKAKEKISQTRVQNTKQMQYSKIFLVVDANFCAFLDEGNDAPLSTHNECSSFARKKSPADSIAIKSSWMSSTVQSQRSIALFNKY